MTTGWTMGELREAFSPEPMTPADDARAGRGQRAFNKLINRDGFRPLRSVLYGERKRGGVVGFELLTKKNALYVCAIYDRATKGEPADLIYGEPLKLPGFTVYLRATASQPAGVYRPDGVRVDLRVIADGVAG